MERSPFLLPVLKAFLATLFTYSFLSLFLQSPLLAQYTFQSDKLLTTVRSGPTATADYSSTERTEKPLVLVPPSACLINSTTLEELVECIFCHMPGRDSEGYRVPSPANLTEWGTAIDHMLNLTSMANCNDVQLAGTFLEDKYSMQPFMDAITNKEYCVLVEIADDDFDGMGGEPEDMDNIVELGWGTFVVDLDPDRELSIQVPHPDNEEPTARQGICVFKGVSARSFLMAGADRRANRQCSDIHCSGCAGPDCGVNCDCSGSYDCPCGGNANAHDTETSNRISDVTHTNNSPFHQSVISMHDYYAALPDRDWVAIQLHGKTDGSCAPAHLVLSEGINRVPLVGSKILDLRDHLNPPWSNLEVAVSDGPGPNPSCLLATRNPQGHILNGLTVMPNYTDAGTFEADVAAVPTGRFLHIEQSEDYRCPENLIYAIKNTWRPVDVHLVLDMSGSMNDLADPGCVGSCPSKLEVLKNAMAEFLDIWMASSDPVTIDRFGLSYFGSDVDDFQSGDLLPLPENKADISADIMIQVAQGFTAMGGGLQRAINNLNDQEPIEIPDICTDPPPIPSPANCYHVRQGGATDSHNVLGSPECDLTGLDNAFTPRHVIVFTDGRQNRSPEVKLFPIPGEYKIVNTMAPNSNIGATAPPTVLNVDLGVFIHTIATTVPDSYTPLLEAIADDTNGAFNNTSSTTLAGTFYDAMVNILSNSSPQLVDYRYGTIDEKGTKEAFDINSGGRRVVLKVSWASSSPVDVEVYKDGKNVSQYGRWVIKNQYKIFIMDLPAKIAGSSLESAGRWELQISGQGGTAYEVAAIVDEPSFKYEVSLGNGPTKTEEPLLLQAEITYAGKPINNARITASISSPKTSLGTLCATPRTAPTTSNTNTTGTAGNDCDEKLRLLLQGPAFEVLQNPNIASINLESTSNGLYSAKYLNTKIPGPYLVKFKISVEGKEIGLFQRTVQRTTTVSFGQAELAASALRVQTVKTISNGSYVALSFRPKDKWENYLGPGFKDQIEISYDGNVLKNEIEDFCEGTYSSSFFVPNGADPVLVVTVVGFDLYNGLLSGI